MTEEMVVLHVHYDPKFTERPDELRRQGGKSLATAEKADRLSKKDTVQGEQWFDRVGRLRRTFIMQESINVAYNS